MKKLQSKDHMKISESTVHILLAHLSQRLIGELIGYSWSGGGRTGLMVRASDFGSGDPGSILGRVGVFVSLSKRHLLPKKYW